jgi:hypothetical protein
VLFRGPVKFGPLYHEYLDIDSGNWFRSSDTYGFTSHDYQFNWKCGFKGSGVVVKNYEADQAELPEGYRKTNQLSYKQECTEVKCIDEEALMKNIMASAA